MQRQSRCFARLARIGSTFGPPIAPSLTLFSVESFLHYGRLMRFSVTLDRDEDGLWIAECPAIPGCISQGDTRDSAVENIRDAIKLSLEVRAEHGIPLTVEAQQAEVLV